MINENTKAQQIRDTWKRREIKSRKLEEQRRREARQRAEKVAELLKNRYDATTIYIYGSLAWGKHFSIHSDIDLLVEGFPKDADYWGALAESERIAAPYPLSLVLAEDAYPGLNERVRKEGVVL